MTHPLLPTKLYVPQKSEDLVSRPRLIRQLDTRFLRDDGFGRKLTLLSAPAGYGKTTLAVEWLHDSHVPVAWLSLDEADNDPVRFLTYLVAAFGQVVPTIGADITRRLQSGQPPPPEMLISTLIHELAMQSLGFVLVLDDYHVIQNPTVHRQITFLIEHQPSKLHLVLITREDPPLPLARLRAGGEIVDIRQQDLRFTVDEVEQFLQPRVTECLSAADLRMLQDRIEGWPAGLHLTSLLLQKRTDVHDFLTSFTGSSRYIMDYLLEEVLEQQPPEVQDFLLQTSILNQFSASLCDAVTGQSHSLGLIQSLVRANLFIVPLDETREWYRYHNLFVDLLRHRQRIREEPATTLIHDRASKWFETQGYSEEAIHHALESNDWDRASSLILDESGALLKRGEITTLLGWFRRLPDGFIRAQPELCIGYAWPLLLAGQLDAAATYLDLAQHFAEDHPQLIIEISVAQAFLAWLGGDIERAVALSQEVLAQEGIVAATRSLLALNLGMAYWHAGRIQDAEIVFQDASQAARQVNNHYVLVTAAIFQARILVVRGELQRSAQKLQELIDNYGQIPVIALAHLDLGWIHYEWNDLESAGHHMARSLEISQESDNAEFQAAAFIALAYLNIALGNSHAAGDATNLAVRLEDDHDISPPMQARIAGCHALVALALGNLEAAAEWSERVQPDSDPHPFYRYINLTRARLSIAQGTVEQAAEELAAWHRLAEQSGWTYGVIAVRALQAVTASTPAESLSFLEDALATAHPERFIRTFVDAGDRLIPILRQAAQQGIYPDYIGSILNALQTTQDAVISDSAYLVDPLSERELEVLRLLVAGFTNPEIAEQLVISVGTAKTHVHNIYNKLGVRNRAEAISRSKELGLT